MTRVGQDLQDGSYAAGSEDMPAGVIIKRGCLDDDAQRALLSDVRNLIRQAPLFVPVMPKTGRPFSVHMTNAGSLGWVSDKSGYCYQAMHPDTGKPWPAIPAFLLQLWRYELPDCAPPQACLVNVYGSGAKLGSHVDRDEVDQTTPVLSVSLGDSCVFHVGGRRRGDAKTRTTLHSGDVLILGGVSRRAYHGVDRIRAGTSDLLGPDGGRINLTLRRVE